MPGVCPFKVQRTENSGIFSMDAMLGADFWIGLFKIVWINIILSGDNAVVIALAARGLPPQQQKKRCCSAPVPPWCCVLP
jgi:hypothetical protein